MSRFVLDCSVAVAWCYPEERGAYSEAVLDAAKGVEAWAPSIWPIEMASALWVGERRARLAQEDSDAFIRFLRTLNIRVESDTSERALDQILPLARLSGLSPYDAAYLELALRLKCPLATLDGRLREAAAAASVPAFAP